MSSSQVTRLSKLRGGDSFTTRSEIGDRERDSKVVFVDLKPSFIDEVCADTYHWLFHPVQHITGREYSANNYTQGHCTIVREVIDLVLDRIHKLANEFRIWVYLLLMESQLNKICQNSKPILNAILVSSSFWQYKPQSSLLKKLTLNSYFTRGLQSQPTGWCNMTLTMINTWIGR
ncbi:hypothetical protein HPG69_001563 [Diceros bicornis minor]|uniref:Uncharacterized protein n=1 Tax=Diceros bicornis minor TaxID=77932 RepID=A0A7J7FG52_DICBM|nr:hypothetical protein HPG69_001563 [Diceros bicornis minor]